MWKYLKAKIRFINAQARQLEIHNEMEESRLPPKRK